MSVRLYTKEGKSLSGQPWNVYPRPQLKRDSFLCLNGEWDFAVNERVYTHKILVPFAPESILSEVETTFSDHDTLWYKTEFSLPDGFVKERVILHFGAVDQKTEVLLNGTFIGRHVGGYLPFSFDITDFLDEKNVLEVSVKDTLDDFVLPYGKQCRKRGGMWYTPVTGIWQTVWLESVGRNYVKKLKIDVKENDVEIAVLGAESGTVTVKTPDGERAYSVIDSVAKIHVENPRFWSPEDPYLYHFSLDTGDDLVESYFALRTLDIREIDGIKRLCLNGKPYFFHGLLDQGYWSDGLFTPATPKGFEDDILEMKKLGFNMLRKHIKIEPEQFYYDCDRLGMVVFQDMVNNGRYSFFRDTALPTVFLKKLNDRLLHRDAETRNQFEISMYETVEHLYNHPSICYWTIFNEGWGQFCSSRMYHKLKSIDSTRFIDSASGWFSGGETDVDSRHVYFKKVRLKPSNKPLVLSEFGGYSYKPEGHVFNTENTYGYGKFENRKDFVSALRKLYLEEVIPHVEKGLCAAVYTQVSDVEDETNGLLSYDREILKVSTEEFLDISKKLTELP